MVVLPTEAEIVVAASYSTEALSISPTCSALRTNLVVIGFLWQILVAAPR